MRATTFLFCLFLAAASFGQDVIPKTGYVPDSATALKVAEAVLIPVYGQAKIESQRPFTARLKDGVWTVSGTLLCAGVQQGREVSLSPCQGILEVRISKSDAHILEMLPHK
jgi:NTF2 fold immunity protein